MGFHEYQKAKDKEVKDDSQEYGLLEEVSFPVDAFPSSYREIIESASKTLNTERSHLGTAFLGAVSLAIGNTKRVRLGPHDDSLPAAVWLILVEASGAGKGRAQKYGFKPIEKYAQDRRIEISNQKSKIERTISDMKSELAKTKKEEQGQLKHSIHLLEVELMNLDDYFSTITDITMEAVRTANLKNRRGIGIVRDEISGWYGSFGKYSKSGASSAEESFYIEVYDGATLLPFRAGSQGVVCEKPYTTVFGGTQPDTLGDLGRNNRLVSGFVFRILFSFPNEKPLPMRSMDQFKMDDSIDTVTTRYHNLITKISSLEMHFKDDKNLIPDPDIVPFNKAALEVYVNWSNEEARFVNELNVDVQTKRAVRSIVTRSNMSLIRLCLIIEVMKWSSGESSLEFIHPDTVRSCARIMKYYRYTMLKVYSDVEKIRLEQGHQPRRSNPINYQKVFNGRKELNRQEMKERISVQMGVTELTAEKYLNEDYKIPVPPFNKSKNGRQVVYSMNK